MDEYADEQPPPPPPPPPHVDSDESEGWGDSEPAAEEKPLPPPPPPKITEEVPIPEPEPVPEPQYEPEPIPEPVPEPVEPVQETPQIPEDNSTELPTAPVRRGGARARARAAAAAAQSSTTVVTGSVDGVNVMEHETLFDREGNPIKVIPFEMPHVDDPPTPFVNVNAPPSQCLVIRIVFPDQCVRSYSIPNDENVSTLLGRIHDAFDIKNRDILRLRINDPYEDYLWLQNDLPLFAQGVLPTRVLEEMTQRATKDNISGDPMQAELICEPQIICLTPSVFSTLEEDESLLVWLYEHCKRQVLKGNWPVAEQCAIELAAIGMYANYGAFAPERHRSGFMRSFELSELLPPGIRNLFDMSYWETRIFRAWSKLTAKGWGNKKLLSKLEYVMRAAYTPYFGSTVVHDLVVSGKRASIGVAADGLIICNPVNNRGEEFIAWADVSGCFGGRTVTSIELTLNFKDERAPLTISGPHTAELHWLVHDMSIIANSSISNSLVKPPSRDFSTISDYRSEIIKALYMKKCILREFEPCKYVVAVIDKLTDTDVNIPPEFAPKPKPLTEEELIKLTVTREEQELLEKLGTADEDDFPEWNQRFQLVDKYSRDHLPLLLEAYEEGLAQPIPPSKRIGNGSLRFQENVQPTQVVLSGPLDGQDPTELVKNFCAMMPYVKQVSFVQNSKLQSSILRWIHKRVSSGEWNHLTGCILSCPKIKAADCIKLLEFLRISGPIDSLGFPSIKGDDLFTQTMGVAKAALVSQKRGIRSLVLRDMSINLSALTGALAFAANHAGPAKLQDLDMSGFEPGKKKAYSNEDMSAFAEALKHYTNISSLALNRGNLQASHGQLLAGAVTGFSKMRRIDLSTNPGLGYEGVRAILEAIPAEAPFAEICVSDTGIGGHALELIELMGEKKWPIRRIFMQKSKVNGAAAKRALELFGPSLMLLK